MKTTNYTRFAAAAFAAIAALACSKAETAEPEAGNPEIPQKTPFTITAAFDDGEDRTSDPSPETRISMVDDGVTAIKLTWKTDDKIYVVNDNSTTVYAFTVQSVSADGKTASFAAPDSYPEGATPAYALHQGTVSYTSFDPAKVLCFCYFKSSASNLSNNFPLYAKYDAAAKRLVFKSLMSVLKLNVTLPEAVSGSLDRLRISSKNNASIFYIGSMYDITGDKPERSNSNMDHYSQPTGVVQLSGGTTTSIYISLDPGTELAGKQLEITLTIAGVNYTAAITGGSLEAGKCYPLTLGAEKWTAAQ